MADIFQEVDEEVRKDRYQELWQRHGRQAIGMAVLLVVLAAGWVAWDNYRLSERMAQGGRFEAAMDLVRGGDAGAAVDAFVALAPDAGAGYAALAGLRAAALLAGERDRAGAAEIYDRIAANGDLDPSLRDLATVLYALTVLDTADPAGIQARLAPLAAEDSPWRWSALEISALAALRAGDTAGARDILARIVDDVLAPPGLRARAGDLLSALGE